MGIIHNLNHANEELSEEESQKILIDRMGEFYRSKDIRLMEGDVDDFIRLLKNLREDITQIMKQHTKIDLKQTNTA